MKQRSSEDPQGKEAVVLLGHGSRVPTAGRAMERVAARLRELGTFALVEVCHMSMQEPTLADALETCAKEGASKVVSSVFSPRGRISWRISGDAAGKGFGLSGHDADPRERPDMTSRWSTSRRAAGDGVACLPGHWLRIPMTVLRREPSLPFPRGGAPVLSGPGACDASPRGSCPRDGPRSGFSSWRRFSSWG
jgi:hypothetical protein